MRYPAIEFVALHGRKIAIAVGALAALLAAVHVTLSGFGPFATVIAGVAAGAAGCSVAGAWGVWPPHAARSMASAPVRTTSICRFTCLFPYVLQ